MGTLDLLTICLALAALAKHGELVCALNNSAVINHRGVPNAASSNFKIKFPEHWFIQLSVLNKIA